MKTYLKFAIYGLVMMSGSAMAQERTAGGATETQLTWTMLASQISAANTKANDLENQIKQITECGKRGLVFSDGQGCVPASSFSDTRVASIIACNSQKKFLVGNACVDGASTTSMVTPPKLLQEGESCSMNGCTIKAY